MRKFKLAAALAALLMTCGCNAPASVDESSSVITTEAPSVTEATSTAEPSTEPETEHVTAPQQEVGYEGMTAIAADSLNDGTYHISVDSSSSMFKIADCILYVKDGSMTADLIIGSKSYDALYMGNEDDARDAADTERITYTENESGQSVFNIPVEALDKEIQCAALSAKKQEWYGRTLVFRADSLPEEAFSESRYSTVSDIGLADGIYTVNVQLEGGSGRATVSSPAKLIVENGQASAEIVWSSSNYDYMIVGEEKLLPTNTQGNSTFVIPVSGFDYKMPVSADTTAMSVPYEIEYTLFFDSASVALSENE